MHVRVLKAMRRRCVRRLHTCPRSAKRVNGYPAIDRQMAFRSHSRSVRTHATTNALWWLAATRVSDARVMLHLASEACTHRLPVPTTTTSNK